MGCSLTKARGFLQPPKQKAPAEAGALQFVRAAFNPNRLGGEEILSAAMIVGEPNPLVGGVHDRIPVMLLMEDYDRWLGANSDLDDLRAMLRPYDADLMEAYAVSRAVNSVKNDTEECIEPVNEAVSTAK